MAKSARIEKRKVTLTTSVAVEGGTLKHEVVDYVPLDLLDAYVAHERPRWQAVTVGSKHDPGPGGDDGLTHYPEHLAHPSAGLTIDGATGLALQPHEITAWHAARAAGEGK